MLKVLGDAIIIGKIFVLEMKRRIALYASFLVFLPIAAAVMFSLIIGEMDLQRKILLLSGSLVFSLASSSVNGLAQGIAHDKLAKRLKLFITSPIHPASYVLGRLLSSGFENSVSVIILLTFAYTVWGIPFRPSPLLCTSLILTWLSLLGIGVLIGTYSRTPGEASMLSNIITFLVIFAAPIYYSPEALPSIIRPIFLFLPVTYAAHAIRRTLVLGTPNNIFVDIMVLLITSVITMFAGFKGIKWREK